MKKEKGEDRVEEKKFIALNSELSDCETKDDEDFDEEDMRLFIQRYNRYMWEQANKHSKKKDHGKSRRLLNSSKDDENKKSKGRSTCYPCGKES